MWRFSYASPEPLRHESKPGSSVAGCKRHKLFCRLWGLWRKGWNSNDGNRTNLFRVGCYWVPFLTISLFEKLDPFLLEYMTYPNCQKKSSKIKLLLSGLFLPAVWRGFMESLLTCTILPPSICCLMSLYRDWIAALLVLSFSLTVSTCWGHWRSIPGGIPQH